MRRNLWISLHIWTASFFAPILVMMAISGGLYLLGIKGNVKEFPVSLETGAILDLASTHLEADVGRLLKEAGIDHQFEDVIQDGEILTTRPTSRVHYVLQVGEDGVRVTRNVPDLPKRLMELHKGHGPTAFKTLQKFMAVGLLIIVISGFVLGLSSVRLRAQVLGISGLALLLFLWLAGWS